MNLYSCFIPVSSFQIYKYVAEWLTNLECPRTFTDYEDSYTSKVFLFQFINFYSSLIYIAFFKVSNPPNLNNATTIQQSKAIPFYIVLSNFRLQYHCNFKGKFYKDPRSNSDANKLAGDECDAAGCFYELSLNLIIIMAGKQIINNFMEIGFP